MAERKHIEECWQEFRESCIPEGASEFQLGQMRLAFFGGAAGLLRKVTEGLDEGGDEPPDEYVQMMTDIEIELHEAAIAALRAA